MSFDFKDTMGVRNQSNKTLEGRKPMVVKPNNQLSNQSGFDDEDGGVGPKTSPRVNRRKKLPNTPKV